MSFFLLYHLYRYAEISLGTVFVVVFYLVGLFFIAWISFNNLHTVDWNETWDSAKSAQEFFP